jgi:hypothetical protein
MKTLIMRKILIIAISLICFQVFGQDLKSSEEWYNDYISNYGLDNKDSKSDLREYDFSDLFLRTSSSHIFGVIGQNMQRIQIKWISINKDPNNPDNYYVYGKTRVKSNICEFTGIIKVKTIRLYKEGAYDMPYRSKVQPEQIGVMFCDYTLTENSSDKHTGLFKGISATEFYIDNDTLFYNDLRSSADDMTNNQFVGTWTSYDNNNPKICNWGDYRVPNVSGFDCGAARFSPCEKYASNGWIIFMIANGASPDNMNIEEAQKSENEKWWK